MIPGSCTVVVPELAQNRLQRLFTAHPAIRQAITVIAMSRKLSIASGPRTPYHTYVLLCLQIQNSQDAKPVAQGVNDTLSGT